MSNNISLLEQNRLLSEEVKRRINQLSAINSVAAVVGQSLDLDVTLATALQAVVDVVGAEACGISLIDKKAGEVVLRAQRGWVQDFVVSNPMRIPLGKGMSGKVIATNDVIVDNNLDGDEEYAVPSFREEHFRSIAMAPMHARGEIIGILSIMSSKANSFDADVVDVLRVIADTVGVALGNARLYEASVEQENRLSAVLHSTADGIIATDRNGRISLINQMAERMLGIHAVDLLEIPVREAPLPPTVRDSLLAALSRPEVNEAFEARLENGRVLTAVVSPVYVETQVEQDSATDGWVIVLQDVTHLREAEIARVEFIQTAAHDMRNPLSITLSSLNMLKTMVEEKDAVEVVNLAMGGVQRLRGLLDDLLHLEQIESGYNFTLEREFLPEILYEVSKEVSPLMMDRKITFTQEIPDELPQVEADVDWLKRALHNYLENASKYTQSGGAVALKAYIKDNYIHVEVTDNGPGIPAKAQPKLFERFYRVEGSDSSIRGSGLGLAIVKSVAEAHRGEVYVISAPGEGSTFGLKLPAAATQLPV
ncbi:MAG: hypothetical protein OHK0046_46760 [Anaerolineae bacterium]